MASVASPSIRLATSHQSLNDLVAELLGRGRNCGAIVSYAGTWRHSQAMWAGSLLPVALTGLGLLPPAFAGVPDGRYEGRCVPTAGLTGIPRLIGMLASVEPSVSSISAPNARVIDIAV